MEDGSAGSPGSGDTIAVRVEDSFDVAAVHAWLGSHIEVPAELPAVRQFSGGSSNLTYRLSYPDLELVLRRPPAGHKAASAHDMRREFRVQSALAPTYAYVPAMVGFCDDAALIGSDFYVMHFVSGLVLGKRLPPGLVLDPPAAKALGERLFDCLADLHLVDVEAAGLGDLGRGPGYTRRQVSGWSDRYGKARTENVPDFAVVMAWLAANQPDDVGACLIHNDFRLDNAVLDPSLAIAALLDWEMATVGDPLMDLGGALAYWVQADDDDVYTMSALQPSNVPGMPTRAEVVARYAERSGLSVENWPFYEAFGLFRLAVIAQQIYYRFHAGQTTNPRFKDLWMMVGYLEYRCRLAAGLL